MLRLLLAFTSARAYKSATLTYRLDQAEQQHGKDVRYRKLATLTTKLGQVDYYHRKDVEHRNWPH